MNRDRRQVRSAGIRAIEDDGQRYITLQVVTPYVVDDYGSVWLPEVFDRSLKDRMPTLAWGHSWLEPIGRGVSWTREENEGPVVRFRLDDFEDVPMARRAFAQVQSGTIDDCSVGFSNVTRRPPTPEELERWPGCVEVIEDSDLDETSLVLRGAVPGAKVVGYRSADGSAGTVEIDAVVELGRKLAAGEITQDEAQSTLDLLAAPDTTGGTGGPPAPPVPDPTPDPEAEALEAEATQILDGLGRSD